MLSESMTLSKSLLVVLLEFFELSRFTKYFVFHRLQLHVGELTLKPERKFMTVSVFQPCCVSQLLLGRLQAMFINGNLRL